MAVLTGATDVPAMAFAPAPPRRSGARRGDLASGQPPGSDTGFDPHNRGPHDPRAAPDRLRRLPQGGRPRWTHRPGGRLPQGQEARLPAADRLRRVGREDLQRSAHAALPEGGARSKLVLAVVNFPPRQIADYFSEVLT